VASVAAERALLPLLTAVTGFLSHVAYGGVAMAAFKRRYGATPLHLLAALGSFAIAGYAVVRLGELDPVGNVLRWFVGAIVAQDLVLLPLYSLVQRIACRLTNALSCSTACSTRSAAGARPPQNRTLVVIGRGVVDHAVTGRRPR